MAITTASDMVDVQILTDAVKGRFRGKSVFMNSVLVSRGAVRVSGTMPEGGPGAIGKKIDIPYFGLLGEFVSNPDGSAVTPQKLAQVLEQATIARESLAAEVSAWSQGLSRVNSAAGDPYEEAVVQLEAAATLAIDKAMVDEFKTTELVLDVYNANAPVYASWDMAVDATTLWGDEQDDIVAMVTHSQSLADMAKEKDANGKSLLVVNNSEGVRSIRTYNGVPLLVSDRVPLDGSTMGTVTASGTAPPTVTLAGTPLGPYKLAIDVVNGGLSNGTATFKFSTDGGNSWSATYAIPNGGGAIVLDDSAQAAVADINGAKSVDSLLGRNGKTGITATFANGTYNADNLYKSKANLKVTDLILQADAGGFWFSSDHLKLQTDRDILADTDIVAMHLYRAAKRYRRRRNGSRPGVVAMKHNVRNYTGVVDF
jgi:hypothetical protein